MSVSTNVCGNCANFKPKQGEKFFNCTYAQQAGVKYAMQVRADTRSCDAFSALNQPAKPPTKAQPTPPPAKRTEPRRPGLCPWGRMVMLAAIVIIILLLSWGAYTCYSGRAKPTPTPTPTPIPTSTVPTPPEPTQSVITPKPPPTPLPIIQYNLGDWVTAPPLLMLASSVETTKLYYVPAPMDAPIGTSFLIVTITVTNGGTKSVTMTSRYFHIVSESGFSFPAKQQPFTFYNEFPFFEIQIGPGSSVGGRIVFNVPDAVTQLRLQVPTSSGIVQWIIP